MEMVGGRVGKKKSFGGIFGHDHRAILLKFLLGSNILQRLSDTVATRFFSYVYTGVSTLSFPQTLEN